MEVVNEGTGLFFDLPANDSEVLPPWLVRKKLLYKGIAIARRLGEEKNARRKTVNAMHHECALSALLQFGGEQRPR